MNRTYLELGAEICDVLRKKAQEIPVFKKTGKGLIRVKFRPCCKEADEWLGGLSNFDVESCQDPDIVDYELDFSISPGSSHVINYVDNDGTAMNVDCYAFSALKIAHCSLAQDLGIGLRSGLEIDIDNLTEDNGYGPYRGAICVEIKEAIPDKVFEQPEMKDWCWVYVCVSGAKSEEDEACALEAVPVIRKFFDGVKTACGELLACFEDDVPTNEAQS